MMELPPVQTRYKRRAQVFDVGRVVAIATYIEQQPGCTVGQIARVLDCSHNRVQSALLVLDNHGLLLAEDERGGLSFVEGNTTL